MSIVRVNPYFKIPVNYPNLVVNFSGMETEGTTLGDKSPNALHATMVNTPTQNTGTGIGKTITFLTNQYAYCADNAKFSFTAVNDVFTVVAVVKKTAAGDSSVFSKYGAGALEYGHQTVSGLEYFLTVDNSTGAVIGRTCNAALFPADGAFHFMVFKKTAGAACANHEMWCDNVQIDTTDFTAGGAYTAMEDLGANFEIARAGNQVQYLSGTIQCLALIHEATSVQQCTNWYATWKACEARNKIVSSLRAGNVGYSALKITP